ncbi:MAG: phosphate signaling complex PhoU family protein [Microthrixaceae bacterium]
MCDRIECEGAGGISADLGCTRPTIVALHSRVDQMGIRVDENLERMLDGLRGVEHPLAVAIRTNDEIDRMLISLTYGCYELLEQGTVAAPDLRFVLSAMGIIPELDRVGHLALGVVNLVRENPQLARSGPVRDVVLATANDAVELFRTSLRAWSLQDLGLAAELTVGTCRLDLYLGRLVVELRRLRGPHADRVARSTFAAGRALERIADHSATIGRRLQYLLAGDPMHLTSAIECGAR